VRVQPAKDGGKRILSPSSMDRTMEKRKRIALRQSLLVRRLSGLAHVTRALVLEPTLGRVTEGRLEAGSRSALGAAGARESAA
jgi:hypothetical protein